MKNIFLLLFFIMLGAVSYAQQTVAGNITNKEGKPLQDVLINVKNTDVKTTSDANGNYSILVPVGNKTLTFQKVGYTVVDVEVNLDIINIKMENADIDIFDLTLEELMSIEVTVQKRAENILQVPLSVTVLNRNDLKLNHISNMSSIDLTVPGLTFGRSGSDARPTIRGVSTRQIEANGDPAIGFFIDGIYQSRTSQGMLPFVDLERIEIQRGPQGTFFGRNTLGGNICLVSKAPSENFSMGFSNTFGNYNLYKFDGFVNAPVSDKILTRFAWFYENHEGYINNLQPNGTSLADENQGYFRGTIKLKPTEKIEIQFRGNYWKQTGYGNGTWGSSIAGTLRDPATGMRSLYGTIDLENPRVALDIDGDGINDRLPNPTSPLEVRLNRNAAREGEQIMTDMELSFDLSFAQLKSISAYNDFSIYRSIDIDYTEIDNNFEELETNSKTFTQEIHLSSKKTKPFDWIFGVYYLNEEQMQKWTYLNVANPANGLLKTVDATTSSIAAFGQIAYYITDKLRFIAGGRYTQDDKDYSSLSNPNWGGEEKKFSNSDKFTKPTWKTGLDYSFTKDNMLFASVSSGFKSGGFNENKDYPTFDSEEVIAYEIGSKNRFFSNKLQLNTAVFYNQYQDLQINAYNNETRITYFTNAGKSSAKGVELEFITLPFKNFQLSGMVSYINAIYDKFENSPNPFQLEQSLELRTVDLSGKKIERAPDLKMSLSASYSIEIGKYGFIIPIVQTAFTGDYYTTQYNTILDKQGAYTKTNLHLIWESYSKKWNFDIFVLNLEDEVILQNGAWGGSNCLFANYGSPRTYVVKIMYSL